MSNFDLLSPRPCQVWQNSLVESAKKIAKMTLFSVQNVNYGSIASVWECLNPLLSLGLLKRLVSSVVPVRLMEDYTMLGKPFKGIYLFYRIFVSCDLIIVSSLLKPIVTNSIYW